jgi:ABC-type proline/glycine betaine transport system permease subunit
MFKTIIEFVFMIPNIILKGVGTVGVLSTSLSAWQLALILTFYNLNCISQKPTPTTV